MVCKSISRFLLMLLPLLAGTAARAENLYDEDRFRSLTSDVRAAKAGDVVTVLIVESSTAESRANSNEDGDFSVNAGIVDHSGPTALGANIESSSNGAARTARAGTLRAQISAKVVEVLYNGNLAVQGKQVIRVNGEEQSISLYGVVRPTDIQSGNVVLSSRLMNADIQYAGKGWVDRSQRPGFFRRILQFIGL